MQASEMQNLINAKIQQKHQEAFAQRLKKLAKERQDELAKITPKDKQHAKRLTELLEVNKVLSN